VRPRARRHWWPWFVGLAALVAAGAFGIIGGLGRAVSVETTNREQAAGVKVAQANVEQARAELRDAEQNLLRSAVLAAKNYVSAATAGIAAAALPARRAARVRIIEELRAIG